MQQHQRSVRPRVYYLRQGGRYAIGAVCLSVIHSVCEQDYSKSNQPISLKLGVMTGPASYKNWLTFGSDPLPDTDSGSLFHFPRYCGIGDFRRFISISRTATGRFIRHTANDWRRRGDESIPWHFGSDPANVRIWINLEIQLRNPDHFWLRSTP